MLRGSWGMKATLAQMQMWEMRCYFQKRVRVHPGQAVKIRPQIGQSQKWSKRSLKSWGNKLNEKRPGGKLVIERTYTSPRIHALPRPVSWPTMARAHWFEPCWTGPRLKLIKSELGYFREDAGWIDLLVRIYRPVLAAPVKCNGGNVCGAGYSEETAVLTKRLGARNLGIERGNVLRRTDYQGSTTVKSSPFAIEI